MISATVTKDGNYMATSSQDASIKIWDLRNWKCVTTHRLPKGAHKMQFSQMGKLATAFGNVVEVWNGENFVLLWRRNQREAVSFASIF